MPLCSDRESRPTLQEAPSAMRAVAVSSVGQSPGQCGEPVRKGREISIKGMVESGHPRRLRGKSEVLAG